MVSFPTSGGVIVTGGAQGIGRRIVHTLVREGIDVMIADLNEEKARAVLESCAGEGRCAFVKCDVSSQQDCEKAIAAAAERFGSVFGIVNNASIFSTLSMRPFWEIPEGEWDQVLQVNLKGVWQMTKAALPEMRKVEFARVVNISSGAVHLGRADYAHYVASKAGVIGLSRAMARELGDFGIGVNAVTPGPIFTEVPRATVTEAQKHQMIGMQCLKREGAPQDIAEVVVFLLSYRSAFMSGQTLNVDGGMIMH